MIIWLASFPRSGNTLTRIVLYQCFGMSAASVYLANSEPEELEAFYGSPPHPRDMTPEEFIAYARSSPETFIIKTHELPTDNEPAIVIVRDGRAACASYARYQKDFNGHAFPLEQVVIGAKPLQSWTEHYNAWSRHAGRTLVVRYEDMRAPSPETMARIGAFIGKPQLAFYDITFTQLQAAYPKLFQVGQNDPGIRLIERQCPALFWTCHGDTMRVLGYGAAEDRPFSRSLVDEAVTEMGMAIHREMHMLRQAGAAS